MPTYDYRCKDCRHEFELFQSMKDKPKRKCPACGKNTLERLIGTGAAVLFKGSGFYQTDYRSESYKKAAEAEKPKAESKSDSASDSKSSSSDTKPKADAPAKDTKKKTDAAPTPNSSPKKKASD